MALAEVIQVIATHSLAHSDIERKKCVYSQVYSSHCSLLG